MTYCLASFALSWHSEIRYNKNKVNARVKGIHPQRASIMHYNTIIFFLNPKFYGIIQDQIASRQPGHSPV